MVCRNDKPSIWGWFVQSIKHGELGIFVERLGLTWVYPKFSKEKCDPSRFVMAQLCYARKLEISQFAGVREPKDHFWTTWMESFGTFFFGHGHGIWLWINSEFIALRGMNIHESS